MSANETVAAPPTTRTYGAGLVAGIVAGVAMAMYAMVAGATYQDSGFFTPLYHIASTFIEPTAMETSMQQAMGGDLYYFSAGPAIVGLVVHMMVAIAFGLIFAIVVRSLRLHGAPAPAVGVVYGLAVFAVMSVIVLPAAANLFGRRQAHLRHAADGRIQHLRRRACTVWVSAGSVAPDPATGRHSARSSRGAREHGLRPSSVP
jgi:hypothetical protein